MVQIGFPEQQFVIDVAKTDVSPILPYLSSRKWRKIFFNGKFDEQFMLKNYDTPVLHVFDCMIAEKVLAPESKWGNSFEELAAAYLGVELNKEVRKSFFGKRTGTFTEAQIKYSAEDVDYLFPLMEMQAAKLEEKNLTHVAELEFEVITVVSNMELQGVPVNPDMWRTQLAEYQKEHAESRKKTLSAFLKTDKFDQQLGFLEDAPEVPSDKKSLNLGSPDQLKKAFWNLGIKVESTKDQVISNIDHPAARALTEYRGLDKLITSYGDSFLEKIHPFTGRIHANWHQVGTETGRFSCSQPNLQQIPPKFRACVGGVEDYVLVGADFSQMELRILAQESKDPILVDAFQTGKDIHTVTATTMFNIKAEDVTKEQRYAAKTLNFGITYGMKVMKFVDMINGEANKSGGKHITRKQGSQMMDQYKQTYRVANRYLENLGSLSLRTGMTQTPFGRKRFFTPVSTSLDPKAYQGQIEAIKRQGANMPIQGTNADITKMAMVKLHEDFRDYGYKANIILQVHDEIVVLVHKSQAEAIRPLIADAMIEAGKDLLPDIPIKVDTYVAEYWAK